APEAFDTEFEAHLQTLFGSVVENFEPWQQAQKEAHGLAGSADWADALRAAERSIELFPDYVDEGSPYLIQARAHRELEQPELAAAALADYHRLGGHDPGALMELADSLRAADDNDAALAVLRDLLMVAPLDQALHAKLGDWLLEAGDAAAAVREYQAFLAMNPHDLANAHYRLARAYHEAADVPKSREHLLYAL